MPANRRSLRPGGATAGRPTRSEPDPAEPQTGWHRCGQSYGVPSRPCDVSQGSSSVTPDHRERSCRRRTGGAESTEAGLGIQWSAAELCPDLYAMELAVGSVDDPGTGGVTVK